MQLNKKSSIEIIQINGANRAGLMKLGEKSHMEDFYNNGTIYLNTFSYFKNLEICEDGRADKDEYLSEYHSGEKLNQMKKDVYFGKDKISLSKENGLLSFSIDIQNKEYTHIFCMSYINILWAKQHNKIIDEHNFAKNKDYIVLVYNIEKFFELIKKALIKNKLKAKRTYIEYVDRNNFSGEMGCFKKFNDYSYQNEWRLAVNCKNGEKPFKLIIGSLKGIASHPITKEEFLSIPFKIKEMNINSNY